MPEYAVVGSLTYGNNSTGNSRRNAFDSVLTNHPNVQPWSGSQFDAGVGGSQATVTIAVIAPDFDTVQAFRDDLRPQWTASARVAGFISTIAIEVVI